MKTLFTLIAALICTSLSAQISKGQWLVGGSLSGMYQKGGGDNNYTEKAIQAPVNAGYFVSSGIAIGIRGTAQYKEASYNLKRTYYYPNQSGYTTYEVKTKAELYSGGPFFRAYLMPGTQKFNVYVEPHFAYGWYEGGAGLVGSGSFTEKFQSYNLNIAPVIFLTPSSSLEFILSYNYTNFTTSETNAIAYFFGVGFQVFLGKGKQAKAQ